MAFSDPELAIMLRRASMPNSPVLPFRYTNVRTGFVLAAFEAIPVSALLLGVSFLISGLALFLIIGAVFAITLWRCIFVSISLDSERIVVRNILRTVVVQWNDVDKIGVGALRLTTPDD